MEQTNMEQKNNMNFIIAFIAIAVLVLAGVWWWQVNKKSEIISPQAEEQKPAGLGGQLYESVNNPVEGKVPETNPFKTETNPIKGVYKNPFE